MNARPRRAGLRAGIVCLALIVAACGDDDGGGQAGGNLADLVDETTTTSEVEETTTTTESGGSSLFDDEGTGVPGSGIFTGGADDHDVDVDADAPTFEETDPETFFGTSLVDPELARSLYEACRDGDMQACDTMYLDTLVDSPAETYGAVCGGALPSADAYCVTLDSPQTGSYVPLGSPFDGTDEVSENEQSAIDACELGGMNACDALYSMSEAGSPQQAYGGTCGGRIETTEWCSDLYGLGYGYFQAWLDGTT